MRVQALPVRRWRLSLFDGDYLVASVFVVANKTFSNISCSSNVESPDPVLVLGLECHEIVFHGSLLMACGYAIFIA